MASTNNPRYNSRTHTRTVQPQRRTHAATHPRTHAYATSQKSLSAKSIIALVLAVLVALGGTALALSTCEQNLHAPVSVSSSVFASSKTYDWRNLVNDDGRLTYVENGQVTSAFGIDVSEHQGYIDWNAVAQDGVDFAFVRVGNRGAISGDINTDVYFEYNLQSALASGLDVGAYFFSQAVTEQEAVEEAEFVLAKLDGAALSYPIAYDHEPVAGVDGRADGLTREQMTANAKAFCDRIAQAGYAVMVYGNSSDLARYDAGELGAYGIWYAEYGVAAPSRSEDLSIWQYDNGGTVTGISTVVDLNIRLV